MGVTYITRCSLIKGNHGYKIFECGTYCVGVMSQNVFIEPPAG